MLLLDTQVVLWLALERADLGSTARHRIATDADPRFSPISIAELTIKQMNGRLRVPSDLADQLAEHAVRELAYRSGAATAMDRFPALVRTDPFDRMLLAQAAAERADFLTADRRLLGLGLEWVLDARA